MKRRFGLPIAIAGLLLALAAPRSQAASSGPFTGVFSFKKLNSAYSEPDPRIEPVRQGPITVALRSPENRVDVLSNQMVLRPSNDGSHTVWLTLELMGQGKVEAELTLEGGGSTRLADVVELPRQTLLVTGRVHIERVDGAYRFTGLELPPSIVIEIGSKVATTLVETCNRFGLLLALGNTCKQLDRALTGAEIPLPPAGESYLLADELTTPEERAALAAYLARSPR